MNSLLMTGQALGTIGGFVLSTFFSLLWAVAATHKLLDWPLFREQLNDYHLLPPRTLLPVALVLLMLEILTCITWLVPAWRLPAVALSTFISMLYAAAMGTNLVRGRRSLDCGCGGAPQAVRPALVMRNLALALLAMLAAQFSTERLTGLHAMDWITIAGAGLTLFGLYAAYNQLLANNPPQSNA